MRGVGWKTALGEKSKGARVGRSQATLPAAVPSQRLGLDQKYKVKEETQRGYLMPRGHLWNQLNLSFHCQSPQDSKKRRKKPRVHHALFSVGSLIENHPHQSRDPKKHTLSVRVD